MKEIIFKLIASFDTNTGGFSSRKLTAFVIIACVVAIHIKYIALGNFEQLEMVLTIDYGFIVSLFGMTTYQSIRQKQDEQK